MYYILLNFRVVFDDEIFVLDYVWMVEVLSEREFLCHLLDNFLCKLLVVVHLYKLAHECLIFI